MKPAPSVLSKWWADILRRTGYREEKGQKPRSRGHALRENHWQHGMEKIRVTGKAINGTHRSDTAFDAPRSDGSH